MQGGAGVGHKTSGARTPSVQRGPSVPATLPILNGFEQDSASIHRCFLAFLPGSGLRVECDVTYSKQTTAPFLPGARTARSHARSSVATALSNRELELLEPRLTHGKQTIAPRPNRELSTNRCHANSHLRGVCASQSLALTQEGPLATSNRPFLTGSASQTESPVTNSKQTTAPFLTGARTHIKRSIFRSIFHRFSSEHFPTRRRISLQDGIAQPWSVAGTPRMHALVGRR
jgi:hypothetical protein